MTLASKVDRFNHDVDTAHQIVHGPKGELVDTEGGPVPTLATVLGSATEMADRLDRIEQAQQGSAIYKKTWTELSALLGTFNGQGGFVTDDGGTHLDPTTGSMVANTGQYSWSGAGWTRIADYSVAAIESKLRRVPEAVDMAVRGNTLVFTDPAGNRSWIEIELGTGLPTAAVAAALRPLLQISQEIAQVTAAMPVVSQNDSDSFTVTDPSGHPSWLEAEMLTGRPTNRVATAIANAMHFFVGPTQPDVWPGNWLLWVQTDSTHHPIQTYIVKG